MLGEEDLVGLYDISTIVCYLMPNPVYTYIYQIYRLIGLVGRVFANGPGDLSSIPGRVILKTFKMVLDTSLLNIQQYEARIKGKVEQSRERSRTLPIGKGTF